MTTLQLRIKGTEEIGFNKDFNRVVIALERRAPTDKNIYLRINADKNLTSEELMDLASRFDEVDCIKKEIFDQVKIIYADGKSQTLDKNFYLAFAQFEPQKDGSFIERIIFHEVE